MISDPIRLSLTALALPFRRPITFLRCALLPFLGGCVLQWMFFAAKVNGEEQGALNAAMFLVGIVGSYVLLPCFSESFCTSWRRAIVLDTPAAAAPPLLRLEYLPGTAASVKRGLAETEAHLTDSRERTQSWAPLTLGIVGVLIVIAIWSPTVGDWMPRIPVTYVIALVYVWSQLWTPLSNWDSAGAESIGQTSKPYSPAPPAGQLRLIVAPIVVVSAASLIALGQVFPLSDTTFRTHSAAIIGWVSWVLLTCAWHVAAKSLLYRQLVLKDSLDSSAVANETLRG